MAKLKQLIENYVKLEKLKQELLVSQIMAILLKKRTDEDTKYDVHYQAIGEELRGKGPKDVLVILTRLAKDGYTHNPWAIKGGSFLSPKEKLVFPESLKAQLKELMIEVEPIATEAKG